MKIALIGSSVSSFGLRVISSLLKREGHDVMLFLPSLQTPYVGDRIYSDSVLRTLGEMVSTCDWVGLSVISNWSRTAAQVSQALREHYGGMIVWGGIHSIADSPEKILRHCDVVVHGEGEAAASALGRGIPLSDIRGISYRERESVVSTPSPEPVSDLDSLPFPDIDFEGSHFLLTRTDIAAMTRETFEANTFFAQRKIAQVNVARGYHTLTSRGCPFDCTYCCNSALRALYRGNGRYVRFRSIDSVIGEFTRVLARHPSVNFAAFEDDEFAARPLHELKAFCERWKAEIGLPFRCYVAPTHARRERMMMLRDAGCVDIGMGIESGSERVLRKVFGRNTSRTDILAAASQLCEIFGGVNPPVYDIILDNPFETDAEVAETIKLINDLPRPFLLIIFSLTLFGGTELASRAIAQGLISESDLDDIHRKSTLVRKFGSTSGYARLLLRMVKRGRIDPRLLQLLTSEGVMGCFAAIERILRRFVPQRPSWDIGDPDEMPNGCEMMRTPSNP